MCFFYAIITNMDNDFSLITAWFGDTNEWDSNIYSQKHKNLYKILDALEISLLFRFLFQHGNDYHLSESAKNFVLYIDEIFPSPIGKALRLNDLSKILKNKEKLFEILEKFDLVIEPYPKNYSIWFHNTNYYYYKLKEDISSYVVEINDSNFTDSFFRNREEYYFLSNTQLHDLFQDMTINKDAFEKEGQRFIHELGEIAYKRLNENSDHADELYKNENFNNLDKICDVIQILYTKDLSKDSEYQKILSEISTIEKKSPKKINDLDTMDALKTKLHKIENSNSWEFDPETERIINKYIKKGKIERVPFTSEEGFICMYGIDSYKTLKEEVLRNSSYKYIK